jgi:hypothetical protein
MDNPFKGLSKTQLYMSLAGFAGITGYLVIRHHKQTGSWNPWSGGTTSDTTSTTQADPVTGLPYSQDDATDPVTGMTYLAEAQQYGSVAAAEASVSQFGTTAPTGSGIGVQPASPAYPVAGSPSGTQTGTPYTSNATWAQAATAGLTDIGYDGQAVAEALGAYLQQEPLTPDQVKIVNAARAEYGPPPVGNPQIIPAPPSSPAPAKVPGTPALSITPHPGYADFGFGVTGATSYHLTVTGAGGAGTGTSHFDETVTTPHVEHLTLSPGHYVAYARAINSAGQSPDSPRKPFTIAK